MKEQLAILWAHVPKGPAVVVAFVLGLILGSAG